MIKRTATVTVLLYHNCVLFKAKFHYASWSESGSKLVADRFEANSITLSGLNQLRTSSETDSVMEFGGEPASSC